MKKSFSIIILTVMAVLMLSTGVSAAFTQDNYIRDIGPDTTVAQLKDLLKAIQDVSKDNVKVLDNTNVGTGYTLQTKAGAKKAVVLGDVNGDGFVNANDYLILKRSFLSTYSLVDEFFLAGDIDASGEINSSDYLKVKRYFVGTYNFGESVNALSVPILLYHHILPDDYKNTSQWQNNDITISTTEFDHHMSLIRDSGYSVVTIEEAVEYIEGYRTIPKKSVVLCFDDGYKSNTSFAAPILRKYGYQATVFHIMEGLTHKPTSVYEYNVLQKITFEDMEENNDVLDIQCHTYANHNYLSQQTYEFILSDLNKSQNLYPAKYFAYPYGVYSAHVIEAVEAAGFVAAFTTVERNAVVGEKIYEIPRYTVTSPMSDETYLALIP